MLEQGEILTLSDDKEYVVVFATELNSQHYVYLIDQDNYTNTIFCEYDGNDGLEEVSDPEIIEQLMIKYTESNN